MVSSAVRTPRRGARSAWVLLAAYLLLPVVLTLSPDAPVARFDAFYAGLRELVDRLTVGQAQVSLREAESLANVLLFVPVGFLLPFALARWPLIALLAVTAAASLTIEVVQFALLPERVPSLIDVLNNTGGAAIGLVLGADGRVLVARVRRSVSARRRR